MNTTEQGIVLLLKSAITGEAYHLPEDFRLEEAYPVIQKQGIEPLCYIAAVTCGIPKSSPVMVSMFQKYCQHLRDSESQLMEIRRIYNAFESHGIDFMPVKGCNMKLLYPAPELRTMGDADILIKLEQYPQIERVMQSLGFRFEVESDHELVWKSDRLFLELHKKLIPSNSKDYYAYYGDGWKLAKRCEGHHYYMTDEDMFLYIFTHYAKHYRIGGVGCRQLLDLWVCLRAYPSLDLDYIRREAAKLQLEEFFDNTMRTIDVWFNGAATDGKVEAITKFLFSDGIWGTEMNLALAKGVAYKETSDSKVPGWLRNYLEAIFQTPTDMKRRYPIFGRYPVLLPFSWPYYWVTTLLFRQENVRRRIRLSAAMEEEDRLDAYEKSLEYVGLRFNFRQ